MDQLKEYLLNHDDVGEDYKADIEKLAGIILFISTHYRVSNRKG